MADTTYSDPNLRALKAWELAMKKIVFLKLPEVEHCTGMKRATIYQHIHDGTFPPPVRIGTRAVAWPEHEVEATNAARIAAKSDDEIRALVSRLEAERKELARAQIDASRAILAKAKEGQR